MATQGLGGEAMESPPQNALLRLVDCADSSTGNPKGSWRPGADLGTSTAYGGYLLVAAVQLQPPKAVLTYFVVRVPDKAVNIPRPINTMPPKRRPILRTRLLRNDGAAAPAAKA